MADALASPGFAKHPNYQVRLEVCPRRIRIEFAGVTIADTIAARYLFESKHLPVFYLPIDDIDMSLFEKTAQQTNCPFKGDASYWSLSANGRKLENGMWGYEQPYREVPELFGLAAFYWEKMDHWYEEDEEIFVHPRDPYKRIDVVPSSRTVQVELAGQILADSANAMFLFETNLPTRYYLPREDVRMHLLSTSQTTSQCPYKGIASHWNVTLGEHVYEDIVWSYPEPIAECPKIRDLLCFYNENVDAIKINGKPQPKPATKWSK
jgi:uncharacterized protein (DUF427 family)